MKNLFVIILAVAMLFIVSACNIKDVTKIASVGEESIGKGEFNFYLMQAKSQATSVASQNGDSISTESDWNTVMIDDVTAAEYAKNLAKDTVKQALVLKAKAIADGEKLTEEDLESVKTQKASLIEQLGGRYNYEQVMAENGFTLEDVENIIKTELLGQKATEKYFSDNTDVSDEDAQAKLKEDYVFAKHILITPAPEAQESEAVEEAPAEEDKAAEEDKSAEEDKAAEEDSEEKEEENAEADADALKEEAKKKAEDIIKKLNGGADFDALMKANSADVDSEGNLNGENGYLFTKGDMVEEFEKAAFALKEGEITKEPVETSYGYHIIKRLPLPTSGEEYDSAIEKIKSNLGSDKAKETIDKWAEELGFSFNDKAIEKIKM